MKAVDLLALLEKNIWVVAPVEYGDDKRDIPCKDSQGDVTCAAAVELEKTWVMEGETRVVGEEIGMFCKSLSGCTFCGIGGGGMVRNVGSFLDQEDYEKDS